MLEEELKLLLRPPIPIEGDVKEFSKSRFYVVIFYINLLQPTYLKFLFYVILSLT